MTTDPAATPGSATAGPAGPAVGPADPAAGAGATERRFARFCRWLLLAYPRHYRRRHGPEIVTTLLEMAPAGRSRPEPAEALHLIGAGLRQRFRLPAGRPLGVLVAVLVAVTAGAFGAAAGSWAGAQTFADLPDDTALTALAQRATGVPPASAPMRWPSPWWHDSAYLDSRPADWDAEQARRRMAAEGWSVSGITALSGSASTMDATGQDPVSYLLRGAEFTARADGLVLHVRGYVGEPPGRPPTGTARCRSTPRRSVRRCSCRSSWPGERSD